MKEMSNYMIDQLQYCGNKALNSTCQLFFKSKPIGSGVFLEIEDNRYLLSAAHVLEPMYIQEMTIPNGEILIGISGILKTTSLSIGENRANDKIDIAIVKLSNDRVQEIEKRFRFLRLEEIDIEHNQLESHQYMFCGYPTESTIVDRMNLKIQPTPLKVRTKITDRKLMNVPEYSGNYKLILDYQRSRQRNVSIGENQFSPDPHGLSGAGLWSLPCNPIIPAEDTVMKLVGIMTDYFSGEDQVVCATTIKLFVDIINTKVK